MSDVSILDWIKNALSSKPVPPDFGIDWDMYSEDGITMIVLGWAYRERRGPGDRRPQGEQPWQVDGVTGITAEDKLLPPGLAIPGLEVALRTAHYPDKWASVLILRDPVPPATVGTALRQITRDKWTKEEAEIVHELAHRFRRWALMAMERGWVECKPPVIFESEDTGIKYDQGLRKDDGLPWVWHLTPEGMEEAERRIPGTEQARYTRSALATASPEERAHAARTPGLEWAVREMKDPGDGT